MLNLENSQHKSDSILKQAKNISTLYWIWKWMKTGNGEKKSMLKNYSHPGSAIKTIQYSICKYGTTLEDIKNKNHIAFSLFWLHKLPIFLILLKYITGPSFH